MAVQSCADEARDEHETSIPRPPRSSHGPGQITVHGTRSPPQAAANRHSRAGASDPDEGVAAFPPVEHITSPETAWLAEIDTLFAQRDSGFESAWRMQLGSATDLTHSGAPYVFEQIVPKA